MCTSGLRRTIRRQGLRRWVFEICVGTLVTRTRHCVWILEELTSVEGFLKNNLAEEREWLQDSVFRRRIEWRGFWRTLYNDGGDSVIRQPRTGVRVNRDMGPYKGQPELSNTTESKHTRAFFSRHWALITFISRMEFVQIPTETVT